MSDRSDHAPTLRVLLVEDNPGDARLIREYLSESDSGGIELGHVEKLSDAIEIIGGWQPDVVLLDLGLPDSQGLATVNRLREAAPTVPVIVLTGLDNSEISLAALKEGAQDYLYKGNVQSNLLPSVLRHAIERQRLINEVNRQATNLRAANDALSDSELRFEAFLKASPDSICIKDAEGRYVLANGEFERRMGLERTDWIGQTAPDIYGVEWARFVAEHDQQVLKSGSEKIFEVDIHPVAGTVMTERVVKFPLRDGDGRIMGLGVIASDITDRKFAEQALERSVRALRTLSSCNEVLVRAKSEPWLLKKICQLIGEIGGYPLVWVGVPDEKDPGHILPIASFGDDDGTLGRMWICCSGDTEQLCPVGLAIRDGRTAVVRNGFDHVKCASIGQYASSRGFRSAISLPLLEEGNAIGALSIFSFEPDGFETDEVALLTELANDLSYGIHALRAERWRETAEAELLKLKRAVEQSPNIVIITDATGVIEYVNPKFTQITGYGVDEAIGNNPRFLKSGETAEHEYSAMWSTVAEGGEWRGVFHNKCKDGSLYWAETAISPVRDRDGNITHFIGIQEDISRRVLTEQKLRQSEKMQALGNLAGGIAHDFNNMLLPILTLSKMAMRDLPEGSKQVGRLKNVVDAAERASELVKRILAFSRTAEIEKMSLDLGDVVWHSLDLLRATLPATIDLKTRIDSDVGAADVDQAQLQTIILNLASNAADAIAGKTGRLEISLKREHLAESRYTGQTELGAGDYAKLVVCDDGPGIPAETLSHVFEPFFTTKAVGEGTGLGLAMVHGIVIEHGGAVTIESTVGEGTRIEILLPLATADSPAPPVQ